MPERNATIRIDVSPCVADSVPEEMPRLSEDIREGRGIEFKSSLFFAPVGARTRQVEKVAQTIAAFMNSEGGSLYLGVMDDGRICGIDSDLKALRDRVGETRVEGPHRLVDYDYSAGTLDKYSLKIAHLVDSYLGSAARALVSDPVVLTAAERKYLRLDIKPSIHERIYFQTRSDRSPFHLFYRGLAENLELKGFDRDEFVARKVREPYEREHHILLEAMKSNEEEIARLRKENAELRNLTDPLKRSEPDAVVSKPDPVQDESQAASEAHDTNNDRPDNQAAWYKKRDGMLVNPDDLMEPARRRAVARAYREGRMNVPPDVVYKYMSSMMKIEMPRYETFDFLSYIWHNE